jgi:hypothetical protein
VPWLKSKRSCRRMIKLSHARKGRRKKNKRAGQEEAAYGVASGVLLDEAACGVSNRSPLANTPSITAQYDLLWRYPSPISWACRLVT